MTTVPLPTSFGAEGIHSILSHGPGFIFVDKVESAKVDMDPPQIRAIKNVSSDAWWAKDHFSGDPMMPGVLMLEGLNQTAGILLYFVSGGKKEPLRFVGFGGSKIRKSAFPGDRLEYFVEYLKEKRGIFRLRGEVTVNDYRCMDTTITLAKLS